MHRSIWVLIRDHFRQDDIPKLKAGGGRSESEFGAHYLWLRTNVSPILTLSTREVGDMEVESVNFWQRDNRLRIARARLPYQMALAL